MNTKSLSNLQVNMIKELTGISHNGDLAVRKFMDVCNKYKADPETAINDLTKGYEAFALSKRPVEKPEVAQS